MEIHPRQGEYFLYFSHTGASCFPSRSSLWLQQRPWSCKVLRTPNLMGFYRARSSLLLTMVLVTRSKEDPLGSCRPLQHPVGLSGYWGWRPLVGLSRSLSDTSNLSFMRLTPGRPGKPDEICPPQNFVSAERIPVWLETSEICHKVGSLPHKHLHVKKRRAVKSICL